MCHLKVLAWDCIGGGLWLRQLLRLKVPDNASEALG
jgi:hypothetical protein